MAKIAQSRATRAVTCEKLAGTDNREGSMLGSVRDTNSERPVAMHL
jgi:hypothetical protein